MDDQLRLILICFFLSTLLLTGCSINKSAVLQAGDGAGGGNALASRAEAAFAETPRTAPRVREAYMLMREAALQDAPGDTSRYNHLQRAARFAVWLIANADADSLINDAVLLANTAVASDSNCVEGYYYRAIAIGLLAQNDKLKGRAAMREIQEDAGRAVVLDASFDYGGPLRVLGALYLRAPGPPAGVGSLRRATNLLQQAHETAPGYPENILFLAEAYLEAGRIEDARSLLDTLPEGLEKYGDDSDHTRWRAHAQELRQDVRL